MNKKTDIKSVMERAIIDLEQKSIESEKRGTGTAMPDRFKRRVNESLGKEVFKIKTEKNELTKTGKNRQSRETL